MPQLKIKIKRLKPNAKLPSYAHTGDAGLDLYSLEDATIPPKKDHWFLVGFSLEFPSGYVALVMDKGGISRAGLHTMSGVFDSGFRGEYNVHLVNLSDKPYKFEKGDKLAQLLIMPVAHAKFVETEMLSETSRGKGRFGSTGRK